MGPVSPRCAFAQRAVARRIRATRCVAAAVTITGLSADKIELHNQYLGGGFGRRLETDSVEQALHFARKVTYPIKIIWTREEDIRHDIVRPMYHDRISALLDTDGRPVWYGDLITGGLRYAKRISLILSRLRAPLGVVCTFGNHDYSMYGRSATGEGLRRADFLEKSLRSRGTGFARLLSFA